MASSTSESDTKPLGAVEPEPYHFLCNSHDSEAGKHIPRILVYQLQPEIHIRVASHVSCKLHL